MNQPIIPPTHSEPAREQSKSSTCHFDLFIAYRLLINAYMRSTDRVQGIENKVDTPIKSIK